MKKDKKIVQPPFLKEGDKIAFVSPAYRLPEQIIKRAAKEILSWGLEPVMQLQEEPIPAGQYAGSGNKRAEELCWALEEDDIKAIICSRGGYGSIHLLNRIPASTYVKHPKWLIGHGDITTLLCAELSAGVMGIHGQMALQLSQGVDVTLLRNLLFGKIPQYELKPNENNCIGRAEGILVGGNLSSFSALAGTQYYLYPGKDIILFIEDTEEPLHNIDRLFYMLGLQNVLSRIKGVIFGEFNSISHDVSNDSVEKVLIEHLNKYNIPVCCGFPVGSNDCVPLIEGAHAILDVQADKVMLTFDIKGDQTHYQINKNTPIFL